MSAWISDELDRIGRAEELEIASLRGDGSLRKAVTIWVVRVGDDLFVRSAYGRNAAWFRAAEARREGRITAGGIQKDVTFAAAEPALDDAIDAAYRSKYREHAAEYVDPMVGPEARATTLMLVPR